MSRLSRQSKCEDWYCGNVVLWYCGTVVLWYYGTMVLWLVLWYCGTMVLWYITVVDSRVPVVLSVEVH